MRQRLTFEGTFADEKALDAFIAAMDEEGVKLTDSAPIFSGRMKAASIPIIVACSIPVHDHPTHRLLRNNNYTELGDFTGFSAYTVWTRLGKTTPGDNNLFHRVCKAMHGHGLQFRDQGRARLTLFTVADWLSAFPHLPTGAATLLHTGGVPGTIVLLRMTDADIKALGNWQHTNPVIALRNNLNTLTSG